MTLNLINGDIISFLRYIVESFQSLAATKQKQFHFLADTDELLVAFAARLGRAVRRHDVFARAADALPDAEPNTLARFGGDEFVILLPGRDLTAAARFAAELRDAVRGHVFRRETGAAIRLTASYGLCIHPDDAEDARGLLARADALMYGVKERGRDGLAMPSLA